MVGDILGVKLAHAIVVGRRFFESPGKYLNQTTMYNQGGMLGVFASLIALSIIERVELAVILDAVTYGAVLGLVVGRLGCYNYGCCYGKPTKSGCHVCYSNPNAKVLRLNPGMKNVPLIPTQIYCSYANLILFVLFTGIAKSLPYDGLITLLFIILYNGFRIAIQRYRAGTRRTDGATVAFVILVVLAGFFVSYSCVTGSFLVRRPFQHPLSLYGYFQFIVSDRSSLGSALLVSLVAFLFYGVHGKTLGKHTGS
jgi:prolipoprotein diacylglyceryltransferase